MTNSESIGLKLIRGMKLNAAEITYLRKYCKVEDATEVWNEERVLATDYYALPVRYRHLQTALYRRGYEVTGKRPQDKDAVV